MVVANTALFQAIHTYLGWLEVMFILQNIVYDMILRTTGNLFLNVFAMNYVMDVVAAR
jgi:hypothetical protein